MDLDLKKFTVQIKSARRLQRIHSRLSVWKDPHPRAYIQITSTRSVHKTTTAQRGADATWNETFVVTVREGEVVILEAFHDGQHGPKSIGKVKLTKLDADGSDQQVVFETSGGVRSGWLMLAITGDDAKTAQHGSFTRVATEEQAVRPVDDAALSTLNSNSASNGLPDVATTPSTDSSSRLARAAVVAQDYGGVAWQFTKTILKRLPDFTDTNPAKATLEIVKTILELKEGMDDNLNAVEQRILSTAAQIQLMKDELAGWKPEGVEKVRWMDQFDKTLGQGLKELYELRDQSKARRFLVQEADAKRIKDIFESINEARMRFVVEVGIRTFKSVYNIGETLRRLFLDRLTPSRTADHKFGSQREMMGRTACTPGTRVDLLDKIITWTKDASPHSPNVYWLFGPAGTGKSTIAYTIARRFEFLDDMPDTTSSVLLGGNFLCSRQSEETRNPRRIIPTIAYHLALICEPFANALDQCGDFESVHYDVQAQIRGLLVKPWQRSKTTRVADQHYLVIIDALDEIDGKSGSGFLQNLFDVLKKGDLEGLKFFVTSRPDPELVDKVNKYEHKQHFRLQDVEKGEVQDDINTYLRAQLADLADSEVGKLAALSDGLFIYAATIVRFLERYRSAERMDRVHRLISNPNASTLRGSETESPLLDSLYHQILDHALRGMEAEYRSRRLDVLHALFCTSERTSAAVIADLVCNADYASTKDDTRLPHHSRNVSLYIDAAADILERLHAVLYIENNRVLSYHKSFSDFLFNERRSQTFWCNQAAQHRRLAESCLDVMKTQLKFNIANIPSSFILDLDNATLSSEVKRNISAVLSYSCRYWDNHLCATPLTSSDRLCHLLMEFLQLRALFWIEAMNLLELRGRCYTMLQAAANCINLVNSVLASNLAEAARFALYFSGSAAALSTPHLYVSSLSTWPRNVDPCRRWKESFPSIPDFHGARRQGGSVVLMTLDAKGIVWTIGISKDGSRIVSGSEDHTVRVWDALTGDELRVMDGHTNAVVSVAFSNDGSWIVSGSWDKTVRVWDALTGGELRVMDGHTNAVVSVAFSNDGSQIVSGSWDKTVRVWDASTGDKLKVLHGHTDEVHSVTLSNDGNRIVSASSDETVRVWDGSTGEELKVLRGHTGQVASVAFSNDGSQIVLSSDMTVRVLDASTGDERRVLNGHTDTVCSVMFSNDGNRIVSGSADHTVRVWDAPTSDEPKVLDGHTNTVHSVAFSNDGSRIVSGSSDTTVRIWDALTGGELKVLDGHTNTVHSVALSNDGSRIVSGSSDTTVRIWDASTGEELKVLRGHTDELTSVAFSNDDGQIASGSWDKTVRVWDASTGNELKVLAGHFKMVASVAFSHDGSRIVSGSSDETVRVWDTSTGDELQVLHGHTDEVHSVAFSNDDSQIVSGSWDKTVRVWDGSTCEELKVLHGHTDMVHSVALSKDGSRIVSCSPDKTVRVWGLPSGVLLKVLDGHSGTVVSVAFSNDGHRVVSGAFDKTVRVWDAPRRNGRMQRMPRFVREHVNWTHTGWLVSPTGEGYLMFVSPAAELPDDDNILTIPPSAMSSVDFTNACLGDEWHNCYRS